MKILFDSSLTYYTRNTTINYTTLTSFTQSVKYVSNKYIIFTFYLHIYIVVLFLYIVCVSVLRVTRVTRRVALVEQGLGGHL